MARNILPLHKRDKTDTPSTRNASTIVPSEQAPSPSHEPKHHHQPHRPRHENALHSYVNNFWRNEIVAAAAEFAGTFMFLFFAFGGTQVANTAALFSDRATAGQENSGLTQAPNTSVLLYISLIFGFSLMVNVWVFFRVSGGLFNPAVTLGLLLIGAIKPIRACFCFFSQMFAGMAAAGIVSAILPGPLNVSTNLGTGVTPTMGVFLEMFLTSLLVFTIFMLAAEKHKATFLAPIGIGLALFVAEMVGVFFTGGSLNPARSFGPCVVTRNFPGYHYVYWFGPLMGTLLAFGMYRIVKIVEYQTVNPGQDFDDHEAAAFKPPKDAETAEQVGRPNVAALAVEEAVEEAVRIVSRGSREERDEEERIDGRLERGEQPRYVSERELLGRTGHGRV
ncbi:aquaporin-like protein [Ophiobolus disseminans]|uniref:Aquaporin-like protein n=1 Tax=Ophiobolus disseminans TaxID=1469910 RepID=A0A6A7AJQ8_9PLEO|nr:aquaporin-like protein [Ophiobolus disseminans]